MTTTTHPIPTTRNGIDCTRQAQTLEAIAGNHALGDVRFRATNHWRGGTRTGSCIDGYASAGTDMKHQNSFTIDSDLPEGFLGTDRASTPTEQALQALAACMTTTMVYNCAARGIEVRSVEAEVEGNLNASGFLLLDDRVRKGFSQVRLRFTIDADATNDELRHLLQASPMLDVFTHGVPVDFVVAAD